MFEGNMISASQALIKIDLMKNENTDVNLDFLDKTLSENTDYAANNLVDYAMEGNIKSLQLL